MCILYIYVEFAVANHAQVSRNCYTVVVVVVPGNGIGRYLTGNANYESGSYFVAKFQPSLDDGFLPFDRTLGIRNIHWAGFTAATLLGVYKRLGKHLSFTARTL